MSHFYGEVFGQSNSTATRTGSKSSGIRAYAQSWQACLTVSVDHNSAEDKTYGRFNIGPGPSAYNAGSLSLLISDPERLVKVLGMETDDRFRNKIKRFREAFAAIEADLDRAEKSAERRKAARERQERREEAERQAVLDNMTPEERENYVILSVMDSGGNAIDTWQDAVIAVEQDKLHNEGRMIDNIVWGLQFRGRHLYRDEDGDLCIGEAYHCNNLTQGKRVERVAA